MVQELREHGGVGFWIWLLCGARAWGVFELGLIVLRCESMGELDFGFACFVVREHEGVIQLDLLVLCCESTGE